jgi:hypothetical protein
VLVHRVDHMREADRGLVVGHEVEGERRPDHEGEGRQREQADGERRGRGPVEELGLLEVILGEQVVVERGLVASEHLLRPRPVPAEVAELGLLERRRASPLPEHQRAVVEGQRQPVGALGHVAGAVRAATGGHAHHERHEEGAEAAGGRGAEATHTCWYFG